jgi:flagellin
MRINTNVSSLVAQEANVQINKNLSTSLEKLSSGLRINKASDDASGMAIADKLRTQASSIGQGIANANSASALIQIADKAMGEQSNILDIVKTKLIQASTSTTSKEGREAIRKDITKLLNQLDAIAVSTNYNGVSLLNTKGQDFSFQVGDKVSDAISTKIAYAANTEGLGKETTMDKDATGRLKYQAAISIEQEGDKGSVSVGTTASGTGVIIGADANTVSSIDQAFTVSSKDVSKVVLTAGSSADGVTLKTDDAHLREVLDSMESTNDFLTRNGTGNYTFKQTTAGGATATLDFGTEKIDISKLKFSGVTSGNTAGTTHEAVAIISDEDVTITKDSGAIDLKIDSSDGSGAADTGKLVGTSSSTPKDIAYTGEVRLDTGTASFKVDPNANKTNAAIAINSDANTTETADIDFTIGSTNVESITLKASGIQSSVTLSTTDDKLKATLTTIAISNVDLIANDDGTFTFAASSVGATATIDFGDEPIDMSNLKFEGVQNGSAASTTEAIFIETDDAVTITNHKSEDLNIKSADGTTLGTDLVGAEVTKAITSEKLSGLQKLGENGLTSDIANKFMAIIDTALNQINTVRSDFGSTQNQLESSIRNMATTRTNIKAAESVIRDVDYASESANFNKQNIIAQAGTYAMSQANNVQQNVLKLLQ